MPKSPLSGMAKFRTFAFAVSLPALAHAQQAAQPANASTPASQVSEVVVTGARLREEAVQSVPVTVTVVGAKAIQQLHAENITSLSSLVPNLTITQIANVGGGNSAVFIRGFGAINAFVDAEPAVPIYVDGVYEPTDAGSLAQLFDVDRVEVLRGPQSTLLGKNSTAGAVLVTHTRPNTSELGGDVQAEYGSFNLAQVQGSVNIPVVEDKFAIRLYGVYHRRDGYVLNLFNDTHDGAEDYGILRGSMLFKPAPNLSVYLTGEYLDDNSQGLIGRNLTPPTGTPCKVFGYCVNQADLYHVNDFELPHTGATRSTRFTAQIDWTPGPVTLSSITGEKHWTHRADIDLDSSPLLILELPDTQLKVDWVSEELRLSSVQNGGWDLGGRLSWMLGGFFGDYDGFATEPFHTASSPTAAPVLTNQAEEVFRKTYAVFGHADFDITKRLTVSGGIRYSEDTTRHNYSLRSLATMGANGTVSIPALPFTQEQTSDNISFEAGARYRIDDTKMVYTRYATGYRGGGFTGFPSSAAQASVGFGPETSHSIEVGTKTEFFDHRLLFDLTLFDVEYYNLQRSSTVPAPGFGFVITTANVAKARTRGVEIESDLKPVHGLNIRATAGYLDAKYLSYISSGKDLSSTPFPYAPKWMLSISPSYQFDLNTKLVDSVIVEGTMNYRTGSYTGVSVFAPQFFQPAYALFSADVVFVNRNGYKLTVYGENLADKHYLEYTSVSGGGPTVVYSTDPLGRTFGVTVEKRF